MFPETSKAVLELRDVKGNKILPLVEDALKVELKGSAHCPLRGYHTDDGSYEISFASCWSSSIQPSPEREFSLHISVGGVRVPGSPFALEAPPSLLAPVRTVFLKYVHVVCVTLCYSDRRFLLR